MARAKPLRPSNPGSATRSRRWGWLAAVAVLIVVGGPAVWLLLRDYRPDPSRYPVRGVDVSHHQGAITWSLVADDDVAFAYLKASEGQDVADAAFADNWRAARGAGLAVGAYHYFTLCTSGRAQAANFLAQVPYEPDALPPAVDLEFGGNCAARPSQAALRQQLSIFLAKVEAREGKAAILYLTPEFLGAYGPALPDRARWIRSILHDPDRSLSWALWQYTGAGKVKGVKGPVDLDVFAGSRRRFAAFRTGRRRPSL